MHISNLISVIEPNLFKALTISSIVDFSLNQTPLYSFTTISPIPPTLGAIIGI